MVKKKRTIVNNLQLFVNSGIQKQIRTATPLQAPAPQAGASTNFATWIDKVGYCVANIDLLRTV